MDEESVAILSLSVDPGAIATGTYVFVHTTRPNRQPILINVPVPLRRESEEELQGPRPHPRPSRRRHRVLLLPTSFKGGVEQPVRGHVLQSESQPGGLCWRLSGSRGRDRSCEAAWRGKRCGRRWTGSLGDIGAGSRCDVICVQTLKSHSLYVYISTSSACIHLQR